MQIAQRTTDARTRFNAILQAGIFRPAERFAPRDHTAEDKMQDALAQVFAWFARRVHDGHVPDNALVVHALNLRVRERRYRFLRRDHQWRHDVFDVQGLRLELRRFHFPRGPEDDSGQDVHLGLAEPGAQCPEPKLMSAIDLQDWVRQLGAEDRAMLELRAAGATLAEVGQATRQTVATVHRRCRELGTELAQRAEVSIEPRRHRRRHQQEATASAP